MLAALLALVIQALAPPGYMLAAGRGPAPAVVICTGHGPLNLTDVGDRHAPPGKQKTAGVCAFAGHGSAPILTAPQLPTQIRWTASAAAGRVSRPRVFVGRGLAAPPPARGPPSALA